MKKILFYVCVLVLSFALWSCRVEAINLEWDAAIDNVAVTGYELHYGNETGVYTDFIDVGDVTVFTFAGADGKYYFAVLAYDAKGNKSIFSNEVSDYIDTELPSFGSGTLRIVQQ